MPNQAFTIRIPQSGPDMPAGTPGYLLAYDTDGVSVKGVPPPSPGGSITPIERVYNVDVNGTATTPDGAFSESQVFSTVQPAVNAAAVAGDSVVIVAGAPGPPEDVNLTPGGGAVRIAIRSWVGERTDGAQLSSPPAPRLGAVTSNMGAAPIGGAVQIEGFTLASYDAQGAGGYAATLVQTTILGDLTGTAGQHPALYGSAVAGAVNIGAADLYQSSVSGAFVATATGTCIWRGSTISNGGTVDTLDALDCRISGSLSGGTDPGAMSFRACIMDAATVIQSTCKLDATTELTALKAGAEFQDTIFALSVGQGGDASIITTTQSLNYSGGQRGIVCANVLTGNIVITLDETGGIDLQPFYLDIYNTTAHTITVKDSAALTLVVCPTQPAGTGARYTFGISDTTHVVVLVTPREAL